MHEEDLVRCGVEIIRGTRCTIAAGAGVRRLLGSGRRAMRLILEREERTEPRW
jgi:hypothetical protein